jgi:hypothetical protein
MEQEYRTRADQIKDMIQKFADAYLNQGLAEKAFAMLKCVQKNRRLNFFKGDLAIWAAAVVYEIARLNFLFDKDEPFHITPELISDFFGQRSTTMLNKVNSIETACKPVLGDARYCGTKINSLLKFYKTSSGFIIHKLYIDTCLQNINSIDATEGNWFKTKIEEKIQIEKEKHREKLRRRAKKNRIVAENQLDLFE